MGSYQLSGSLPTHVEVELGCDNITSKCKQNIKIGQFGSDDMFGQPEQFIIYKDDKESFGFKVGLIEQM